MPAIVPSIDRREQGRLFGTVRRGRLRAMRSVRPAISSPMPRWGPPASGCGRGPAHGRSRARVRGAGGLARARDASATRPRQWDKHTLYVSWGCSVEGTCHAIFFTLGEGGQPPGRSWSLVGLRQPHAALGHDVSDVVRVVGDDAVDTQVHERLDRGGVVAGPRDDLQAAGVGLGQHLLVGVEAEAGVADLAVLREAVVGREGGEAGDRGLGGLDEVAAVVVGVDATEPRGGPGLGRPAGSRSWSARRAASVGASVCIFLSAPQSKDWIVT